MPRVFPTAVAGELAKRFGTEPLVIVEIEWTEGTTIAYSDRKLNGEPYPYPSILNMSNFQTSLVVNGSADSRNASITLRDTDGKIKEILDTHDIHLRPVRIYLGFQGLPIAEKALMFEGLINSPITWDEGSRTLTIDVFSKLEDAQVGFTMDDGDFPNIPPSDLNKPWPLAFGTTCGKQAVKITPSLKGVLATGQGVPDPTIGERLCQAYYLICPPPEEKVTQNLDSITDVGSAELGGSPGLVFRGRNVGSGCFGCQATLEVPGYNEGDISDTASQETAVPDQACLIRRFNEICDLLVQQEQQNLYARETLTILDGENFPQDQDIVIRIDDVKLYGVMSGTTFTVKNMTHPAADTIDNPPCMEIEDATIGYSERVKLTTELPRTVDECFVEKELVPDLEGGSGASWEYYNTFEGSDFIWLEPGSEVFLEEASEIVHIVSLVPGTVTQVAAYRTFGDTEVLSEVPEDYYDVYTVDYGDYQVVEVRLPKALSFYDGENWSDDLYVSFVSSIGPNPVDVIQYLVEKYTTYTVDTSSFASVHASLEKYPANFRVTDRRSVFKLIQDIAYQFRSAVLIRDNTIYLTYLSKEPTSVKTITESDILSNSFQMTHSPTEDLVTQSEVSWGFGQDEYSFTLKHNISRYGSIAEEYDYFTQNTFSTILKSATFWMIRNSKTWRTVEFTTPVKHLDLDVYDCVTLDIAQFPTTKVVITSTDYDIDSNTVKFKAWTPILSGTTEPYFWAWPALQTAGAEFPLVGEDASLGDGLNLNVTPPEGHPLRAGYVATTARVNTAGDRYPSDLDDVFPTVDCTAITETEIQDQLEPDIIPFEPLAEDNFVDRLKDLERPFIPDEGDPSECSAECCKTVDHYLADSTCLYRVKLTYVTATRVQRPGQDPDNCDCKGNGEPCEKRERVECHIYGTPEDAQDFYDVNIASARKGQFNCPCLVEVLYEVGEVEFYERRSISCEECDDLGQGEPVIPSECI